MFGLFNQREESREIDIKCRIAAGIQLLGEEATREFVMCETDADHRAFWEKWFGMDLSGGKVPTNGECLTALREKLGRK